MGAGRQVGRALCFSRKRPIDVGETPGVESRSKDSQMMIAIAHIVCVANVALWLVLFLIAPAWPGGLGGDHSHDQPSFFGFVKDATGKAIADAKVKAELKGRLSLVARTDATGLYRIPELTKDIVYKDVTISCSKDGYRQVRTLTRSRQPKPPIEIECTMQRLSGK
jgi:hypothetical protein